MTPRPLVEPVPAGGAEHLPNRVRCRHCADPIGAYEPLVVVAAPGPRETSLAAEPSLYDGGEPCFHRACFDQHERAERAR